MLADLWNRYRLRTVAEINGFLLPGPWELRNGRRAIPLPVEVPLHPPAGARLRSWIDRGSGWTPFDSARLPSKIDGPGWWGDPRIVAPVPIWPFVIKSWRKARLGGWTRQPTRAATAIPRPTPPRDRPLVSIVIPTDGRTVDTLKGPLDLVSNCYRSLVGKTTYPNLEILIAHNGRIAGGIPAVRYDSPGPFNLAHKLNFLIDRARGDYVILLNDDTEVIEPEWVQSMLEFAVQPDVGAVGCKLLFADGRIQHAGVVFGVATLCGHVFMGHPHDCPATSAPREFSAVTGACMMVPKGVRLDESLKGTFDVDLCLRMRAQGRRVVYTPHARLFHFEGATFRLSGASYFRELLRFRRRWPDCFPDPFYTPDRADCHHE